MLPRRALAIVKRYGDDAMLEASERADQLLDEGDLAGAETWHRILNAIERLQARAPADEKVH
jgi:triphosphoribosyl-dephospho-CoA synthetase